MRMASVASHQPPIRPAAPPIIAARMPKDVISIKRANATSRREAPTRENTSASRARASVSAATTADSSKRLSKGADHENSGKQGNPLGMIVNAVRGKSRVNGKRHVQESCMKVVVSGCIFEGQGAFDLRKNYWSTGKAALNRSYLRQSRSQT
jgi:hypothetical protein